MKSRSFRMQDNDLEFPNSIEFAYYAIYNLFQKYALHEDIDDWLIVNQAVSSEESLPLRKALFAEAIEAAENEGTASE